MAHINALLLGHLGVDEHFVGWCLNTILLSVNVTAFEREGKKPNAEEIKEQMQFSADMVSRLQDEATAKCASKDISEWRNLVARAAIDAAHAILHNTATPSPAPAAKG